MDQRDKDKKRERVRALPSLKPGGLYAGFENEAVPVSTERFIRKLLILSCQALRRYLVTKEFQEEFGEALGFPYEDVQPRIWKLIVTDIAMWTE